jgi:hypothetical protein
VRLFCFNLVYEKYLSSVLFTSFPPLVSASLRLMKIKSHAMNLIFNVPRHFL